MRIAVDFDGTLSLGPWPEVGPANEKLIEYIKARKDLGDQIILWTCREDKALDNAVIWCKEQGLVFDAINDNLPEVIEFYGNNSRKVSCDLYIDDKSVFEDLYDKYPINDREAS